MEVSGRNQLAVTVTSVTLGDIMAEVVMRLSGGEELVSVITRASAERLDLKAGDEAIALIKATEIMVGR